MAEAKTTIDVLSDAAIAIDAAAVRLRELMLERGQLKDELADIRKAFDAAIGIMDEVFQSGGAREAILPDFLLPGECKFQGVRTLAIAYRRVSDDFAKLQAEREPRDNGDGTVTRLLPVTHPKGLPVECVRAPKRGEKFVTSIGGILTAKDDYAVRDGLHLILRPAPQPPEPVTWEAPLGDGEWIAREAGIESAVGYTRMVWRDAVAFILRMTKPAKLGRYRFVNGVGTLIEESK